MKDNTNKRFWDRFARLYTPIQQKQNAKMYSEISENIANYLNDSDTMLELAMGTGQFTFDLCDKVSTYIATDFSERMIEEAKKIRREGITYEIADATNLKYDSDSFDVVLIANALHVMPDPKTALSEIKRVLKPNGYAILPTFIYEGKMNKFKLWVMARVGFKVFTKWNFREYLEFIEGSGLDIIDAKMYPSKIGPECVVIARKPEPLLENE